MTINKLIARIIFLFISIIPIGCNSNKEMLDYAFQEAGNNTAQIDSFLNYCSDKGHQDIAEHLVCGMIGRYGMSGAPMDSIEALYRYLNDDNFWGFPSALGKKGDEFCKMPLNKSYDLKSLPAQFLINHTDDALNQWYKRDWNKGLPTEIFLETILPYRIVDEEATEWRKAYRDYAPGLEDSLSKVSNSVEAARIISNRFGPTPYHGRFITPHRSALNLLEKPVGKCREDCDRTVYAMRAFGVPVTIDMMIVNPDYGGGHEWNVVYDNEDKIFRMFDNQDYPPTRDSIHNDKRRKGKVYRSTWRPNSDRLKLYKDAKYATSELLDPRLKDVTEEYFGKNKVTVPLFRKSGEVYIGFFLASGMMPVDISRKGETTATFENIEPDLIYFPLEPEGRNKFEPIGYPFMINGDSGLHQFIPDTTKFVSAKLVRKMPVGFLMDKRQKVIDGFKVYVGKTESGPWTLLDSLSREKSKTFHYIRNSSGIKDKYIRLVAPDSLTKELGEFVASSDSVGINALPLSIVGEPKDMSKRKKLIDGDVLSRFLYKPENGDVILKVDSKEDIGAMFLLARNDDNSVRPGDEYELFYFSRDGWKSLGKKTARGFELEYEVPDNSVLWLRDLTRGKEEQIFIIRDGRQLFNYDL